MGNDMIAFGIPILVFVVVGAIVYACAKARLKPGLIAIGLIWAGFTTAMFLGMEQASGWDGLGYFFALLMVSAPSAVAFVLGGLVGMLRRKKVTHA